MTGLLLSLMKARASVPGVALSVLIACGVIARAHLDAKLSKRVRSLADLGVWLALLAMGMLTLVDAVANVKWHRPWDFPSFYAVAKAAASGRAFYDPAVLTAVQAELTRAASVPAEWLKEVGYWYLPPSVFLIWPLGWFPFREALVLHYAVQGAFLLGSAWLLHRLTPLGRGPLGVAMALLLLLLFRPVQSTVYFAQIVFGCLFFLVLAERLLARSGAASGASLALGFLYKHVLLIPAALLVASRDQRARHTGIVALVTVVALMGASTFFLGPGIFHAYAANGPGARSPELAIDPVVQSLLALLYRLLGGTPHGTLLQIICYPPFLIAAGVLTLATLALLRRASGTERREQLWLVTSLGLLCFPNTLISTLALAMPAALGIVAAGLRRGWPLGGALALMAVFYALPGFAPVHAGWIALLTWGGAAALLMRPAPAA